jgi:hypothetical protein
MGNTSAAFRSRDEVDRAVDALASAHVSMDTVRLVTSVDGVMTEVYQEYQWWMVWGATLGLVFGTLAGPVLYLLLEGEQVPQGLWKTALVGAFAGLLGGTLGGIGTWRLRFAVLPRASASQYVVLVEAPEGRRSELEAVLRRNGGVLVPSDGATIG